MQLLPLFPLQLVVFPNEKVNLHIFEPRYKKLIRDCENEGSNFGILPFINGKIVDAGTELELLSIYNLQLDGSCDVELLGKKVFHVVDFIYPTSVDEYLRGKIDYLKYYPIVDISFQTTLLSKLIQLFELLEIKKKLPENPEELVSFDFAHYVGLNINQELELIQIPVENERIKYLIRHLDNFIPQVLEMNNIKKRAKLNGHIKYLKPPLF
jgi:ATP-dependent Lon protease